MKVANSFLLCGLLISTLSIVVSSARAEHAGPAANAANKLVDAKNARGMFFDQLKKPEAKLNTGVIYSIELERSGQKSRVTNKTEFIEGDRIRFHFKPNIDGFAYIVVSEGEKGEKSLLFPSSELPDNKVKGGEEIVLPFAKGKDQAWLMFDNHPGTETVRIIVSRTEINVQAELKGSKDVEPDLKVSSSATHADTVPDGTFMSMEPLGGMMSGSRALSLEVRHAPEEAGEIAVVSSNPAKDLTIDISLEHKKH